MKKRVLLCKPLKQLLGAEELLARHVEIIRSPGATESELMQAVGDVHGIIAPAVNITEKIIQKAPLLQVIATPQVGFDQIDVEAATRAGVPVVANTGVAPEAVAEFTIGLMISLARKIIKADREFRQSKSWKIREPYFDTDREIGIDVYDSSIGIIGLGQIGSTVAGMLRSAFSAKIFAYDSYVSADQMAASGVEKVNDLVSLASKVDFLLLHVNLNNETRHLINRDVLHSMKRGAFLINCSRGEVVDEAALIEALREGWFAGAALDVFEQEPVKPDNPLLTMDNVVLTPHIAGVSLRSSKKKGTELVRRLISVLEGKRPDVGLVNPEVWSHYLQRFQTAEK